MRKRTLILSLLLLATVGLTGCDFDFWEWLAGQPLSPSDRLVDATPSPGDPAGEDAGEPDPAGEDEPPADDASPGGETPVLPPPPPEGEPFAAVQIRPLDEGRQNASFAQFRQELQAAVQAKDGGRLLQRVARDVNEGFDAYVSESGIDAFAEQWGLHDRPQDSPIWLLLERLLDLGGVFLDAEQRTFEAPHILRAYTTNQEAEGLHPAYHAVITGAGVNVRARPDLASDVVQQATYLVVRVLEPEAGETLPEITLSGRRYRWQRVQLPDGKIGYVADRYLWRPYDYRVGFTQDGQGQWRLQYLIREFDRFDEQADAGAGQGAV